nr:hypothetical protein [Tanacetum cinerariifolium]
MGSSILVPLPLLLSPLPLLGIRFLVFTSWDLAYRKVSEATDQDLGLLKVLDHILFLGDVAPDPSTHDDPSVNSVHSSCGVSIIDASSRASSGFSTRKSDRIWPFTDVRGRVANIFFADLEMNLFRLVSFPLRLWTSLIVRGDGSCNTASVLSGHGFIPSGLIMYPRNIPSATPNIHFLGLSFMLIFRNVQNVSSISRSSSVSVNPQQPLTLITAPWPFYKWGIDIAGPFPKEPGKVKFFIVAMDYFTKWIEAKAVATITGNQVKKFVWDNIVCRFGLLGEIGSDNAGIPTEIGMLTYRTAVVDVVHNNEELRLNLDLLEERCECAAIREAKAKLKMTKYYNARVRGVTFRPGYFVYRSNDASHVMDGGKLGPKWEGPYEVTEALEDGAYMLRSMDEAFLL